jgi:hypothetical protein
MITPAANSNIRAEQRSISPYVLRMTACTVNGLAWLYVGYSAGCAAWAELVFASAGFSAVAIAVGAP